MKVYVFYFAIPRKRPNEPKASAIGATYNIFFGCDTQGMKNKIHIPSLNTKMLIIF